ncbi:MAG: hypothetical protein IKN38_04950 [Clostridia bacterium]|nr:hypothetical protein [Clostridia bacterium]
MNPVFFFLMFSSGALISYIMVSDSNKKCASSRAAHELSKTIEETIRVSRAPFDEIIEDYLHREDGKLAVRALIESDDEEIKKLIGKIRSSDLDAALSYAKLLKNYTEKEMRKVNKKEALTRKAKITLPTALTLLIAILLL